VVLSRSEALRSELLVELDNRLVLVADPHGHGASKNPRAAVVVEDGNGDVLQILGEGFERRGSASARSVCRFRTHHPGRFLGEDAE
jgi:hypothetical protein